MNAQEFSNFRPKQGALKFYWNMIMSFQKPEIVYTDSNRFK